MNILWSSFRRAENARDMPLFRNIRPEVTKQAGQVYGERSVGVVRYGRVRETSYILINLITEPDGAKGTASDEFYLLKANLYEQACNPPGIGKRTLSEVPDGSFEFP